MNQFPPKVAFIDDDATLLSGLRRVMRSVRSEWEIRYFEDPVDALAALKVKPVDVAVVDLRMPTMDGGALASALKEALPGIQCIVLSGSAEFQDAVALINAGTVFRYYLKPCEADNLLEGIEDALALKREENLAAGASATQKLASAALEGAVRPVLVTDREAKVLYTNRSAAILFEQKSFLFLDHTGAIRGAGLNAGPFSEAFARVLSEAQQDGEAVAGVSLENEEGEALRLVLTVSKRDFDGVEGDSRIHIIGTVKDGEQNGPSAPVLADLFSLTLQESRLAAALASGQSLDEAAETCGVTKSSARTYLKAIFSKTNVSRQAELVRLLVTVTNPI